MSYYQKGFTIININKQKKLLNLRKKFVKIFSLASKLNNFKVINNDRDIYNLYNQKKKIWISAYDQIRMLPDLYEIIDKTFINLVSKSTNIKIPAFTSKPVIRVNMANDIGTGRADPHIDFPSHRGSKNAVTVWFPLQDTTNKNGTLKIIPKSHKVKTWVGSLKKNNIERKDIPSDWFRKKSIDVNLKLGQAIVISQFLVHSSGLNNSKTIRFSIDFRLNDLADKKYAQRNYYLNQASYYKKTGRGNDPK